MESDNVNPYAAGVHELSDSRPLDSGVSLETSRELMRRCRPWVMFVGVVFLVLGLISLFSLLAAIGALSRDGGAAGMLAMTFVVSATYVVGMLVMSYSTLRFAHRLKRFILDPHLPQLNRALHAQVSVWRVIGLSIAAVMLLYGIMFLAVFAF